MAKLVVLGGGESGVGAALLGLKKDWEVFLSDAGQLKQAHRDVLSNLDLEFEEGQHSEQRILAADLVVKSPGIPDTAPLIRELTHAGVSVISEVEFAFRYTSATIIGITGSNGKTTTTLLTGEILKNAGLDVVVAGNVGDSVAKVVAERDPEFLVLELSSFQLDGVVDFKPHIAIVTNITPDHLDRYNNSLELYAAAKMRIGMNQSADDYFIYCADDPILKEAMQKAPSLKAHQLPISIQDQQEEGAWLIKDELNIYIQSLQQKLTMSIYELGLQGKHNIYNSMAAGVAGKILQIRKNTIRESLSDFQNIEHRLEHAGTVHGIEFINDSKATNVNSTWFALESMNQPVVWIVGGVDKGNDYTELYDLVKDKVKAIICLGVDNEKIHEAFAHLVQDRFDVKSAKEAVDLAYQVGTRGDAVLLSPCCASFDLFESYEDRGRQYKDAVRSL